MCNILRILINPLYLAPLRHIWEKNKKKIFPNNYEISKKITFFVFVIVPIPSNSLSVQVFLF